jgi:hypothetical protein
MNDKMPESPPPAPSEDSFESAARSIERALTQAAAELAADPRREVKQLVLLFVNHLLPLRGGRDGGSGFFEWGLRVWRKDAQRCMHSLGVPQGQISAFFVAQDDLIASLDSACELKAALDRFLHLKVDNPLVADELVRRIARLVCSHLVEVQRAELRGAAHPAPGRTQ